jgi:hypothetical protein
MYPIAQRLSIYAANPRRLAPVLAVMDASDNKRRL